ncbi:hypothetical protein [Actinocrispum sp. NPDC049592]|uniref:hypothetical protein n=1 Tax=Actinocrispum sp. NPDC049592 TaxID=3154835 RepID=UPI003448E6B3
MPWTILRSRQFHQFAGQMLGSVPGPVAVVPTGGVQPIAVWEVAELPAGSGPRGTQTFADWLKQNTHA